MEDGTPDQALLFLFWPLLILGFIISALLLVFPTTRKLGWRLLAVLALAGCGVMIILTVAEKLLGPTRGISRATEQSPGAYSSKAADGLTENAQE